MDNHQIKFYVDYKKYFDYIEDVMGVKVKGIPKQVNPYTQYLISDPITGTTTVTKSGKGKEEELVYSNQETLNKGQIVESLYKLEVGGGQTINIGNYESVRIDCRLTVPVGSKEELNDAYNWATDWVSEKLMQAIKDAKGE